MKQPQARHYKGAAVVRPSQTEHHLRCGEDGCGGVVPAVTVVRVAVHGGEWYGESDRSGDGKCFWVRRKSSSENFSGGGSSGGRRRPAGGRQRLPEIRGR
nr:hypothetical protein [Tanacetum cinerariifolium]